MKYIIIGLGNYGHVLAEELASLGHEVIGADKDAEKVESIKDKIATAFAMDATDEAALMVLPLRNVDVVMVTIGEDLGASVRVVALLKRMKVEHIFARAIDDIHYAILDVFGLDKILTPEEDAARQLVRLMNYGTDIESFPVDKDHYVMKFTAPEKMIGKNISDLHLAEDFDITLITITRLESTMTVLGKTSESKVIDIQENERVEKDDKLVCYGKYRNFQTLWKFMQ